MDKSTIAKRIKALLNKTVENGATEQEAMSAAEKAREMMDRYHLEHGTLGMEEEGTIRYRLPMANAYRAVLEDELRFALCHSVGRFTDTKVWRSRRDGHFHFFGLKTDVDFAVWLFETLKDFAVRAAATSDLDAVLFGRGSKMSTSERADFSMACIRRISQRLHSAADDRKRQFDKGTGTSLIILKDQIVQRDFAKLGINLSHSPMRAIRNREVAAAGFAAGDRASFNRPLAGSTTSTKMIGGK